MSSDPPSGQSADAFAPALESIAEFSSARVAGDCGLALLAMGVPYWLETRGGRYTLRVRPQDAEVARREVRAALAERARRAESESEAEGDVAAAQRVGLGGWALTSGAYGLLLVGMFGLQRFRGEVFTDAGATRGVSVPGFEALCRAVTALTLHGDLGHLLGNVASGALFLLALASAFGAGAGLTLAVASGGAANVIGALLRPEGSGAIGASTAVFAMLGLLVGRAVAVPRDHREALPRLRTIGAGLALLAFLGTGGANTDILGHGLGMAMGAVTGFAAQRLGADRLRGRPTIQVAVGLGTLALLFVAWWARLG